MSWYRVYEIDVLRVGQLFLQQNIDSIYPSAGTVLYTDGSGGTFWSTGGSGGGGVDPGPSSGLTQLQLISTVDGLGQIYTSTSAAGVTGDQLYSTVRNLGTAGYISSAQLTSTVRNLGTAGYVSSTQLRSTVAGLGAAGYISSSQLTSTVITLLSLASGAGVSSLFGVVSSGLSTIGLFTSNTSNYYAPLLLNNYSTNLQSTVDGLGTAGYISTFTSAGPGVSSLFGVVSSGLSTIALFTSNTSNYFLPLLSNNYSTNLQSTVDGLGTAGYISTSQLFSTVAGIGTGGGGGSLTSNQLISTTEGLGTAGYISTSQLFSTVAGIGTGGGGGGITSNQLISTTDGLGTAGYISTSQLLSTSAGLTSNISSMIDPAELTSTVIGLGSAGFLSSVGFTDKLTSTVDGLGTVGYISTSQLLSTSAGLTSNISSMIDPAELTSTVIGLGSAGFLSSVGFTDKLTSTVAGLGTAGYLSTFANAAPGVSSLFGVVSTGLSTVAQFTSNTSNFYAPLLSNNYSTNLQSTVTGLGTAGYISAPQLISTVTGQSILLISTVEGLGLISYISSSQLTSSVTGQQFLLISTTVGLGTAGYISSSQLFSTVAGIGTGITTEQLQSTGIGLGTAGYISSTQLFSTVAGIGTGGGITAIDLTSTSIGLATFGYISTSQLFSTVEGISAAGGGGGLTTTQLTSTVNGLGTAGYISTPSQGSSGGTSGELFYMNYSVANGSYKALEMNTTTAPLQTVVTNINGTVNNQLVTGFQTDFTLPAFILAGFWTINLFLQASSIGITMYAALYSRTSGGVETLIASNLPVVVQTFLTETQFYIPVTYTTISPGTSLVLKIFANNTQSSTQSITTYFEATLYSYVNTTIGSIIPEAGLTSTVRGLGTVGYISSSQLYSTINTSLASTTRGLATAGYISSSQLYSTINTSITSTTRGLGNLGYISGPQLFSTLIGQQSSFTTAIASTAMGLGTLGYISAPQLYSTINIALASTTKGLGTAGYISASQLFSTVFAQQSTLTTAFASTTRDLGTAGYISAPQLLSTVAGLGTARYISAPQLISTVTGQSRSLVSTVEGLGTASYISSSQLISSSAGQQFLLISTTGGLGTAGYISASQLYSTVAGIDANGIGGGITTGQLLSTTRGLGTTGYISSYQLFSTVEGINIAGIGNAITKNQLQSTTAGLGTASYVSTSTLYAIVGTQVRFPTITIPSILIQDWSTPVSTVALFTSNTSNYYNNTITNYSSFIFSTVAGLGTTGYASTTLVYIPNISTQAVLPFPIIGINPLSTVSAAFGTFSTLTTTNTFIGNSLYFYGFNGTYDRTVLAERLISTQTQEFFIFKGSNAGENIRLQASGNIIFETAVKPSLYLDATTQSTPTMLITPSRRIGVNCNVPSYTLDISGSANMTGTISVGGTASVGGSASVGGNASITGTTTVSGVLTSRVRVFAGTITADQTLLPSDTSTYFFYTTFSPSLKINVPTPATAGSGWTVTIQNVSASLQVIFVQTTPVQTLSRGNTVRIFTDGLSWYFI